MKINVTVKPNSKTELVEQVEVDEFIVRVNAPPTEGKANKRVIELLAKYFKTAKSNVELVSGHKNKMKRFKISLK